MREGVKGLGFEASQSSGGGRGPEHARGVVGVEWGERTMCSAVAWEEDEVDAGGENYLKEC